VYAQSKAAGDVTVNLAPKHYLLRTSWVIGDGKNFVRTMLELGQKGIAPTVVADQVGRLTFTSELVKAIDHLLKKKVAYGTYNVSNGGEPASWADITREIFKYAGYDLTVTNTTTAAYYEDKSGIAPRPLKSTLSLDKIQAVGFTPTDWHDDLQRYIQKEVNA
jgi:dTDP-4-dehydrorhamnose 3,5-epimerase